MKKVFKFKSEIYPSTVFITFENDINLLKNKYIFCDNDTLSEEDVNSYDAVYSSLNTSIALGFPVMERSSRELGIMIIINEPTLTDQYIITHESVHVADYIFQFIGSVPQSFAEGNECYAYLVEWVSKCLTKVLNIYDTRGI